MAKKSFKRTGRPNGKVVFKSLYDRFYALNKVEKQHFRIKVMGVTGWSYDSFYRKLDKPDLISDLEKQYISHLLRVPVNQIFIIDKKASALAL